MERKPLSIVKMTTLGVDCDKTFLSYTQNFC